MPSIYFFVLNKFKLPLFLYVVNDFPYRREMAAPSLSSTLFLLVVNQPEYKFNMRLS